MTDPTPIAQLQQQRTRREIRNFKPGTAWRSDHVYGEKIIIARELKRWSLANLAQETGITESDLAAFESETLLPTKEQLTTISLALEFPAAWFCNPPAKGWPKYEETTLWLHDQIEEDEDED